MIADFKAPNPHYAKAMRLSDVREGKAFVLFNPLHGQFWNFEDSIVNVLTGKMQFHSPYGNGNTYLVVGVEKPMYGENFFYADDAFVVKQNRYDNPPYFMVAAEETEIKHLANCLRREGYALAATQLEQAWPEWFQHRRNPNFERAATIDDIARGVELLTVSFVLGDEPVLVCTPTGKITEVHLGSLGNRTNTYLELRSPNYGGAYERSLSDMGVIPFEGGVWASQQMTIVNTPENRRALIEWMLGRGKVAPVAVMIDAYPGDFITKVTAKGGKLVAEIV